MHYSILAASCFALAVVAQNCGPAYGNQVCAAGNCCSSAGWCDTDFAHCNPDTCQPQWSGAGSTCKSGTATQPADAYKTTVPNIDVCGPGEKTCPGAGSNGYFYRCCSSGGHCGPKNNIQDQALYCGASVCQKGFGDCSTNKKAPANPPAPHKVAGAGQTCGPIPNAKCAAGLCCSGSNFCGTGTDFCGSANWCQPKWGKCDSTASPKRSN